MGHGADLVIGEGDPRDHLVLVTGHVAPRLRETLELSPFRIVSHDAPNITSRLSPVNLGDDRGVEDRIATRLRVAAIGKTGLNGAGRIHAAGRSRFGHDAGAADECEQRSGNYDRDLVHGSSIRFQCDVESLSPQKVRPVPLTWAV